MPKGVGEVVGGGGWEQESSKNKKEKLDNRSQSLGDPKSGVTGH